MSHLITIRHKILNLGKPIHVEKVLLLTSRMFNVYDNRADLSPNEVRIGTLFVQPVSSLLVLALRCSPSSGEREHPVNV